MIESAFFVALVAQGFGTISGEVWLPLLCVLLFFSRGSLLARSQQIVRCGFHPCRGERDMQTCFGGKTFCAESGWGPLKITRSPKQVFKGANLIILVKVLYAPIHSQLLYLSQPFRGTFPFFGQNDGYFRSRPTSPFYLSFVLP